MTRRNDEWAALGAAEETLTPEQREQRRRAGEARRRRVEDAGSYRKSLRSNGRDAVERR